MDTDVNRTETVTERRTSCFENNWNLGLTPLNQNVEWGEIKSHSYDIDPSPDNYVSPLAKTSNPIHVKGFSDYLKEQPYYKLARNMSNERVYNDKKACMKVNPPGKGLKKKTN